jgi:thiol:disulfide interchange protein
MPPLYLMMKAITWLASFTVGVAALTASAFATTPEGWSTDLDKAFEKAKAGKKCVLVEFTGSDWCPPCIAMRKNVFSKKEFVSAASKKYILVELDFPKGDKDLADKNQPLAEKYKIEGFPTVILFTPAGKEFTRFFASQFPKTEDFLKHLDDALEKKDLD